MFRWILWINKRNSYIREFNPEKGIRLAQNKQKTKTFLNQRSVPVPLTLAYITSVKEWLDFDLSSIIQDSFVVKPNKWSKWEGIIVITKRKKEDDSEFFWTQGERIDEKVLKKKALPIFDGGIWFSATSDTLLIEERLVPWDGFEIFCEFGLADIRVIVCNLVPIVAMLRMPTLASDGKANLAQGGMGLGIHIVTGRVISLYRKWKSYTNTFPSEWLHLKNKKIPYREEILQYSTNAQYFVNSGYLWLDRVITCEWPKLLEINARAGLEIQNITGKGLLYIIQKVEDLEITTPEQWIAVSKTLFSDKYIQNKHEKNIVYLSQTGKLSYIRDEKQRALPVTVMVNIHQQENYASEKVIKKLLWTDQLKLSLLHNNSIFSNISFVQSDVIKGNKITLWVKTLENYYIQPIHTSQVDNTMFAEWVILEDEISGLKILDDAISIINKRLNLSRILRPINYLEEFDAFVEKKWRYNPKFVYNFPSNKDLDIMIESLEWLDNKYRQNDFFLSQYAEIFYDKIEYMIYKILLIKAYKVQDFSLIDYYNKLLFGDIDQKLLDISYRYMDNFSWFDISQWWDIIEWKKLTDYIKHYLYDNNLHMVKVISNQSNLSRISVWFGKYATIKIKDRARFREYELYGKMAHEVGVHIQRYMSGVKSGWTILQSGVAWYITTEEGLAVYKNDQIIGQYISNYDSAWKYKNYIWVDQSSRLDFISLSQYIYQDKQKDTDRIIGLKEIFDATLKFVKWKKDTSIISNGIIFGKNLVYLNGYNKIKELANEKPDDIKKLLQYGKIKIEDLQYFK